jgi:transcriptional regulator with XRE-family HTH domain
MSSCVFIPLVENFSNRLRQIRRDKGLKQVELAEIIFVSQEVISHYENGNAIPPSDVFSRLGQALDVSLDYLAGLSDKRNIRKPKI